MLKEGTEFFIVEIYISGLEGCFHTREDYKQSADQSSCNYRDTNDNSVQEHPELF